MWAASELARFTQAEDVLTQLKGSAQKDPFWAVRRNAIQTLGNTMDKQLIPFLQAACRDERSAVRVAALNKLGEFKQAELVDFFKQRFQKEDSYRAQAEALTALAKCGGPELVPFLEEAAKVASPRHIIRSTARRALKELENK